MIRTMSQKRCGSLTADAIRSTTAVHRSQQHQQERNSATSRHGPVPVAPRRVPTTDTTANRSQHHGEPACGADTVRAIGRQVVMPSPSAPAFSARASATVLPSPLPKGPAASSASPLRRRPEQPDQHPDHAQQQAAGQARLLAVALAVGEPRGDDRRGSQAYRRYRALAPRAAMTVMRPGTPSGLRGCRAARRTRRSGRSRRSRARSRASRPRARSWRSARPAGSSCPAG